MEPTDNDLAQAISRRYFIRLLGGVGAAAALGPALAACTSSSNSPSAGVGNTATSRSSAPALAASTSAGTGSFAGQLEFVGWDFQPSTIKSLVSTWSTEAKVPVDVQIIPNVGYSPAITTRLRGGARYDVFYNFAYNSQKFVQAGWASGLSGLPGADALLSDIFASARGHYTDTNGALISVPYFSTLSALNYNQAYLTRAGITGPPQSLNETYQQSKKIKQQGICSTPYIGYWIKDFCEEYLNVYFLAENVTPFDDKGQPVFADDPKAEDVLAWWQTMYTEGLTPKSVLTDDPGTLIADMAQGTAAFFVMHHNLLNSIRNAKGAQAANITQTYTGGASGKALQVGEVLQMGKISDGSERAAAWDLMKYYGWKDPQGRFSVLTQWAKVAGLAAPYPGFFEDPGVTSVFPKFFDLGAMRKAFESGSDVVPARILPWYPEFQSKVGDLVQTMLIGQSTPAKTVGALADAAKAAKSGAGL